MALYFKVDTSLGLTTYIFCNNDSTTVDWGDGSPTETFSGFKAHTYPPSSVYTATLTPSSNQWLYFQNSNNIIEIVCTSNNVNRIYPEYCNNLTGLTINNCTNLQYLGVNNCPNVQIGLYIDFESLTNLYELSIFNTLEGNFEIVNSNLQVIQIGYNSNLESLILTGCTNLRASNIYNSPILNLDISTCSLINNLNISNISGCTFPNPWSPNPGGSIQIDTILMENITLENVSSSANFYIQNNQYLETLSFNNFGANYIQCQYNTNLKTCVFDTFNLYNIYFSNHDSLELISGNTNGYNTQLNLYSNLVLKTVNVLNYTNNYFSISDNPQLSDLQLPDNNIQYFNVQNNYLNSYNFINFLSVRQISINNNNFNSPTFTSLLEAGYLSGAVDVVLNIQLQNPIFYPSQNALSFINLLTNTRGWTILYTVNPYPTYAGQLDTTFNEGNNGPDDGVYIIKKQTDGKILIGGNFEFYNDEQSGYIRRLNSDGTLDYTFLTGKTFDDIVQAIELQGDKILVGGRFEYYDPQDLDIQTRYMARLNSDGTLDSTFPTGSTFNGQVRIIKLQPDGKILVGGNFETYDDGTGSVNSRGLIRLNSDGTVDTSFNVGTGFVTSQNGNVYSIVVQDDGKIIVGGWFTEYNGNTAERIVRLNPDGSNDFTMGDPGFNNRVSRIIQQPDGKFLCVGFFSEYSGNSYNRIIRFNTDGTVDTTFQNNNIDWDYIQAIEILDTGKILIGGIYDSGYVNFNMLNSDGTLSDDLNILYGFDGQVNYILQQDHNKVLVGGNFGQYQGNNVSNLARLWLYDPFSIPISAGTEVFICYVDCSGNTVTTSVTHPYWTNLYGQAVIQQDAITLGGNNGYYN